ncbi:MAG: glycosyltransferase [Candidatus Omnitrophica bacterium]|nr:glycosyltransferase [Candidatus Omnitrophota bacterium]
MKTMKIAYFALGETYNSSHAGFVHTYNVVKALSRVAEVKLFIKGEKQKTDIPVNFVSVPSLSKIENPLKYLKSFLKIKREIKKFDIIHERFHINPIDLFFVGKKKYILEINDPAPILYSGFKKKLYLKLIKKKFNRADAIITQTETLKNILSKFYSGKIYVVPNGVDIDFFEKNKNKFDIRKMFGIGKDKIVITFTGSFREWHGVQDIPYIAEKIGEKCKNVVFLLVGSGPLFEEIKNKKTPNMILTGPLPYVYIPSVLYQSDILIAPFNTKRFTSLEKYGFYWCPVKLFEYMASGRPIVSYDYYEIRKITKGSAILARPNDIDEFIHKLQKLIYNRNLRRKITLGKKMTENYQWNSRANEVLKIYNFNN